MHKTPIKLERTQSLENTLRYIDWCNREKVSEDMYASFMTAVDLREKAADMSSVLLQCMILIHIH